MLYFFTSLALFLLFKFAHVLFNISNSRFLSCILWIFFFLEYIYFWLLLIRFPIIFLSVYLHFLELLSLLYSKFYCLVVLFLISSLLCKISPFPFLYPSSCLFIFSFFLLYPVTLWFYYLTLFSLLCLYSSYSFRYPAILLLFLKFIFHSCIIVLYLLDHTWPALLF